MSRQYAGNMFPPSSNTTTMAATPSPPPVEAKLVLLGSQGVGKTSLINRLLSPHGPLPASPPSTIGASFITHRIHDPDTSTTVRLQIWDTAGQERFRSISRLYYRGAHVGVLCYDITSAESWDDMKSWLQELRENNPTDPDGEGLIIHVVGTKSDIVTLDPSKREVPFERTISYVAEQLAGTASTPPMTIKAHHQTSPNPTPNATHPNSKRSSGFWGTEFTPAWSAAHEVNSTDGEGIEEVFRVIARKLVEQRQRREARDNAELSRTSGLRSGTADGSGDDYFGYGQSTGSFRLGHGDKRRSWLGLPSVGLGIGIGPGDEATNETDGRTYDEHDVEEARRRGRCC